MNRSESKYFNTALLMEEALVSLLAEKDFEFITVKEICRKAGVNRPTFYLHYETVSDLLNETMDRVMNGFTKKFPRRPEEFIPGIAGADLDDLILIDEKYLKPYLSFIRENKNVYWAAFRNPASMQSEKKMQDIVRDVLTPIMKRFGIPEKEQEYWIAYHIMGCTAIVNTWLGRNCAEPEEKIVQIMIECIRPYGISEKDEKQDTEDHR